MSKVLRISFLCLLSSFYFSCVSYNPEHVTSMIRYGDYDNALLFLQESKSSYYGKTSDVLYALDLGMLRHFSRDYENSNQELTLAEKLIEDFYSKSITQGIASFLTNDTVIDYTGEEYEDIYSNLFKCLNYIHLGKYEDALVEIRRFDNKQKLLATKYSDKISEAKLTIQSKSDFNYESISFHNSALARYLSMLLYRSQGDYDSAQVDYNYLESAFETQENLYDFAIPKSVDEELLVKSTDARLNIVAFSGLSPKKEEVRFDNYYWTGNGFSPFVIAFPEMKYVSSQVGRVIVHVLNLESGEKTVCNLELLESLEKIAYDTFREKKSLIYLKAVNRALTKYVSNTVLNAASYVSQRNGDNTTATLFELASVFSSIYNVATEAADLRVCRFFPGKALVGGITLEPGTYSVEVVFLTKTNEVLTRELFENMTIKPNGLNLVEAICLK